MKAKAMVSMLFMILFVLTAMDVPAEEILPTAIQHIDVTKTCSDAAKQGDPITFGGIVKNDSPVTLTNVTVVDDNGTPGNTSDDVIVLGPITLGPGASSNYSGSYFSTSSPSTDTVTATGYYNTIKFTDMASATCKWIEAGCTLTQGYWKTHSKYGPAPYDNTWALLSEDGEGEDTPFFLSGKSYYEVLKTNPTKGNAYYILAPQYIAAELNMLNGASIPAEVLASWNEANDLFDSYTPSYIGSLSSNSALRKKFLSLAEILDNYNNGLTGPGHCSGINGQVPCSN